MSKRDVVYVGHMLDMALKAVGKAHGLSRDAYDAGENLRLALIHLIQVIGEAARQVSREFSDTHPEIPWADIIGMRHKVVHDYLGVDEDHRLSRSRPMRPKEGTYLADRQGNPLLGLLPRVHAQFGLRREHRALHGDGQ
jgi:uncharacterized protein with HEPN domain